MWGKQTPLYYYLRFREYAISILDFYPTSILVRFILKLLLLMLLEKLLLKLQIPDLLSILLNSHFSSSAFLGSCWKFLVNDNLVCQQVTSLSLSDEFLVYVLLNITLCI